MGRRSTTAAPEDTFLPARVVRAADRAVEEILEEDAMNRVLKRPLASS